jgi:hypothetical protein
MDPDSGVILARTAEGTALALGLLKCGKIWLCPVCSAKIRHGRSEEVTRAAVEWMSRGGLVFLVTFTARHAASHLLSDLMDAIQGTRADKERGIKRQAGAYQRLITGGTWAGRPERGLSGIRDRVGFLGMIRATEITVSQGNGWHPHIHALVFVGAKTTGTGAERKITGVFAPSDSQLAELEGHFRSVWTNHLAKVDQGFKPSDEHGVDFKRLETVKDAEDFGKYIAKTQDGKDPAKELTRADLKSAKGGNLTPFEMLGRIGDLLGGVPEEDADGHGGLEWCLGKWAEYEAGTKGRRAIEWTRFLRALLGILGDDTEDGDLDLLFEMDGASPLESGVQVESEAWHRVAAKALDLAATEAVEAGELDQVAALVTAAGGKAASVRVLTGAEIEEAWENVKAKLAERRERAAVRRQVEQAGQ